MSHSESLVPGQGTAKVSMIINGLIGPSEPESMFIQTKRSTSRAIPVMTFVIEHGEDVYLWDLGIPQAENAYDPSFLEWSEWSKGKSRPLVLRSLPDSLPSSIKSRVKGVYLSHYHWDHCGDSRLVPDNVPVIVGPETKAGIAAGGLGLMCGLSSTMAVERLSEYESGDVDVYGLKGGKDVFGDGSVIVIPAPGHCAGHSIAIVRTTVSPDTYMVLGGDAAHHSSLYVPCPCHNRTSSIPEKQILHLKPEQSRHTMDQLTRLHQRDDTWVICAHEFEAVPVVPQETNLNEWKGKGWKGEVERVRDFYRQDGCPLD